MESEWVYVSMKMALQNVLLEQIRYASLQCWEWPKGVIVIWAQYTKGAQTRGPFLESPDNFSGPESYFMCSMFTLKTKILSVLKPEQ